MAVEVREEGEFNGGGGEGGGEFNGGGGERGGRVQ